jgi:radical SAM peptide maturase (CXXX-repeat target family)/CXXX repeat peptide maturase
MTTARKIKMGNIGKSWMEGKSKSITFCVTEDCNLACKYCYMTGKNSKTKMDFDIAKKAVDFILSSTDEEFNYEAVIWEFIGGEPFLEMDFIDKVADYIKIRMFILNHKWFNCYRFNFSSNGILYNTPKVQEFIKKNRGHVSIGISVDGNKLKHDLQRVKKDGTGSYEDVVKNVNLWKEQFPDATTKATFSHEDIPYLKDSIISLWNLGLKIVPANVVFENVWHEGDDLLLENQLKDLADYIIENELWWDYSVRFFDPQSGFPADKGDLDGNYCGSGKMLAIDCKGNLFPCIRFYDISLNNRKATVFGNVNTGIDTNKVRPFMALTMQAQSTDECINCEIYTGCAWCTGCNYDFAETDTIYQRATYLCKMHKATCRANEYFWNKLAKILGHMPKERQICIDSRLKNPQNIKYLLLITSDQITPHCNYRNWNNNDSIMSDEIIEKSLDFAIKNSFTPVFLGNINENKVVNKATDVFSITKLNSTINDFVKNIYVFDNEAADSSVIIEKCILLINRENIENIFIFIQNIYNKSTRVNLILENTDTWTLDDLKLYDEQLDKIVELIIESYKRNKPLEINVLSDIMQLDSIDDCGAGTKSYAVAPNGKIYYCPAFYFDDPESSIGSLEEGITIKNSYLLQINKAPICSACDAFHCSRCKFMNKKITNEINTPSKIQCVISHTERNKARALQIRLKEFGLFKFKNTLEEIDYLDPLEKILKSQKLEWGCI